MHIHDLSQENSLAQQFLAELRDRQLQRDSLRFRRNLERIGEVFAYRISQLLDYAECEVATPLGMARCRQLARQPVLATILRAGLPLHHGLQNYFDHAENAFVSAYRKHHEDAAEFDVEIEYLSSPALTGKTLILCDPMLATGSSMVLAHKALLRHGRPDHTHLVTVIASQRGVDFVREQLGANATLWVGAIDPDLSPRAYILPGLGDAGDLAFGEKE